MSAVNSSKPVKRGEHQICHERSENPILKHPRASRSRQSLPDRVQPRVRGGLVIRALPHRPAPYLVTQGARYCQRASDRARADACVQGPCAHPAIPAVPRARAEHARTSP
jgi:hypothetical protein